MNNLSLYDLSNNFIELLEKKENGELTEQEEKLLLENLTNQIANKSVDIIKEIREVESFIISIKEEEKRLKAKRERAETGLDRFMDFVKLNMDRMQIKKITTEIGNIAICSNPMSVEIENENEIPEEFKTEKIEIKIDKTKIKNHFKETGEIVPGAKIIQDKTSIRIN